MDTREEILNAAWDLFGEQGFEEVSLRDVTKAAGVNIASVSYHFGGKEGLIQETVKLCVNLINGYRLKLLDNELKEYGTLEEVPLERIVHALMRPAVMPEECGVSSELLIRLVTRYSIDTDCNMPSVSKNLYTATFRTFASALLIHYPHLSAEQLIKRIVFASGSVVHYHGFGKKAAQLSSGNFKNEIKIDREDMLADVIDFTINGFGGKF